MEGNCAMDISLTPNKQLMSCKEIKFKIESVVESIKSRSAGLLNQDIVDAAQDVLNIAVDCFKDKLPIANKHFIELHVVDDCCCWSKQDVYQYCDYVDGRYYGHYYTDNSGNTFGTLSDVREKYGDNTVIYRSNGGRHYDCVYIPEIDCILIAVTRYYDRTTEYALLTSDMMLFHKRLGCKSLSEVALNNGANVIDGFMEAVEQMLNMDVAMANLGGNKYCPIDNLHALAEYIRYKDKQPKKSGKTQDKIDELIAQKTFVDTPAPNRRPHEYNEMSCKANINKINDNLCVVRWTYSYRNKVFDGMRIYIDEKNVYVCKRNNAGQFVKVNIAALNLDNFKAECDAELVFGDMSGTRLSWYADAFSGIPKQHRMVMLVLMITDHRIEQLVKLGFGESLCNKLCGSINSFSHDVGFMINANENEKNIYRWLGLNKYQLKEIIQYCTSTPKPAAKNRNDELIDAVYDMKSMFRSGDISHFNNQLFDDMFAAYKHTKENHYRASATRVNALLRLAAENDPTGVFERNMMHYAPKAIMMCKEVGIFMSMYYDFVDMVCQMGIRQDVKLYPETFDELKMLHDSAMEVYNMRRNNLRTHSFEKRTHFVKPMEYESKKFDFCVKVPTKPEDLAIEGITLNHCVKSYIDRVAKGETNILFVRKKENVDKPFFTVEVDNNHMIRQVHGLGNCNACTVPTLTEFIKEWADAKKLKCGFYNAVR